MPQNIRGYFSIHQFGQCFRIPTQSYAIADRPARSFRVESPRSSMQFATARFPERLLKVVVRNSSLLL
ncbi:hypothetical protein [Altericista sp. CCNU0014]|uniref:hypothetical protein n=1 Tax=Altericista sp. CCNU0014 TaxID=3082949 RepID=UPI00384F2F14